jgi:hypothetical protein
VLHCPGRRCDPTLACSHSHARLCGHVALAQACTPARVRPSPKGEAWPLAPFLAPDLYVAYLSAAPPWPRRGSLLRARGHIEGNAVLLVGECTPRHRLPLPHTRVCTRTAVALSAATHGAGLSSVVVSATPPIYGQRRAYARVAHLYARAHPSARPRTQVCAASPEKAPDHLPRTADAPTPPCPHRHRPRSIGHLLS